MTHSTCSRPYFGRNMFFFFGTLYGGGGETPAAPLSGTATVCYAISIYLFRYSYATYLGAQCEQQFPFNIFIFISYQYEASKQ